MQTLRAWHRGSQIADPSSDNTVSVARANDPMPSRPNTRPIAPIASPSETQWLALRWLPFAATALFSLVMSAIAPEGRRPFHIDWELSAAALEFSITKAPHISATALLAWLAVFGSGRARWPLALLLTVMVGAGWELCQTTVIGHYARLSDLAPDTLGALIGCLLGSISLWTLEPLLAGEHAP
jgi:VanZ family protein